MRKSRSRPKEDLRDWPTTLFEHLATSVEEAAALAREHYGPERAARVEEVVTRLESLGTFNGHDRVAAFLVRLLETKALEGLVTQDGWTARATATRVLTGLPYPHALAVSAEDLEHLREVERSVAERRFASSRRWRLVGSGSIVAFGAAVLGTAAASGLVVYGAPVALLTFALAWQTRPKRAPRP